MTRSSRKAVHAAVAYASGTRHRAPACRGAGAKPGVEEGGELRFVEEVAMSTERSDQPKNEPRTEEREPRERKVAPPLEREHETQAGILEEEERDNAQDPRPAGPDRE